MRQRDIRKRTRIRVRAQRYANRTIWGLKLSLLVILILGTVYSFGWNLPFVDVSWKQYAVTVVLLILLVFSVASFWNGTTIEGIARRCEVMLEKWTERKFLELAEEQ